MNKQTYYLIADIIQRYRTWIIVKDTELLVKMRILQDGVLKPCFTRDFRSRVTEIITLSERSESGKSMNTT